VEELFADRPAWFVLGPCLGLLVVAMFALLNTRLGVLGGWSEVVERASGRRRRLGTKAWFALGVLGGGLLFVLASGGRSTGQGYGWLTRELGSNAHLAVAAVLVGAGVLIGFGAKLAGGCTSGNGLGGSSFGSPASLVATATFMATAVGATLIMQAVL